MDIEPEFRSRHAAFMSRAPAESVSGRQPAARYSRRLVGCLWGLTL
jgi:hypothetical protein